MITFNSINKDFGQHHVLSDLSFDLKEQGITAILGPNGSGKTTLIKCLLGMVIPNSGDIRFMGKKIQGEYQYRQYISHVSQIVHFPENLTPQELIKMTMDLRQGPTRYDQLINMFELQAELQKKMSNLSGGTRQKVNLFLGLMHDNPVIILDEPSNGLDPVSFLNLKTFLKSEKKCGKLILITTHTMSFVEEIADYIVFLLDGKIYFHGTLQDLIDAEQSQNLESAIARIVRKQVKKR